MSSSCKICALPPLPETGRRPACALPHGCASSCHSRTLYPRPTTRDLAAFQHGSRTGKVRGGTADQGHRLSSHL
jgi:hypothetical protein